MLGRRERPPEARLKAELAPSSLLAQNAFLCRAGPGIFAKKEGIRRRENIAKIERGEGESKMHLASYYAL